MEKEQKSVLILLLFFLFLIVGLLVYSLPGNLYSQQEGSMTEVIVMERSSGDNEFNYRSSIFPNFPQVRDVSVLLSPAEVVRIEPDATVYQDSFFTWEEVHSRRSRTYVEGEQYNSLFFESLIEYQNSLDVSVSTEDSTPIAHIGNNASVAVTNVFVIHFAGTQRIRYVAYVPVINAFSNDTVALDSTYYDTQRLLDIMEEEGISRYAAGSIYNSRSYGYGLIDADPWIQGNHTRLVYQLPESMHDELVPVEVEPKATTVKRFCWVVVSRI